MTDWIPVLQQATFDTPTSDRPRSNLESTFESALLEARAIIESQRTVTADDARALGEAAGERLRQITRESGDLGPETQLQRLNRMLDQVRTVRDFSHVPQTREIFLSLIKYLFLIPVSISRYLMSILVVSLNFFTDFSIEESTGVSILTCIPSLFEILAK